MRFVANDVAQKVHAALAKVTWKDNAELGARFRELGIPWRTIDAGLLAWAKGIEAQAPRLPSGDIPVGAKWPTTPDFVQRLSYAGRVQWLAEAPQPAKVPVQVLRIGEICLAAPPARPLPRPACIQAAQPFPHSFMVELNHGYIGYLPTPRHFELGGYETWPGTNFLEPQAAVKMLDALVEMAAEVRHRAP
jgi:hypothetical protein